MSTLSPRSQLVASFLLEIGVLYAVIFFVRAQENAHEIAAALTIALIPILAFYAHRLEKVFRIPFFVWAIGLGYLFHDSLVPLLSSFNTLTLLVGTFGILIIFGGGLDIKFQAFKRLTWPIISLSVVGALFTAFSFSALLVAVTGWFELPLTIGTIGLLGAMLCSTDPAAIVPVLKRLHLRNRDDSVIAISESAVNDVVGTIVTTTFAAMVIGGAALSGLGDLWWQLFSLEVAGELVKELVVGVGIGYVSFQLLRMWKISSSSLLASLPFFIGVALISYTLAVLWGGSGYLAAFITGLLFDVQTQHKEVEHFFVGLVDGFVKPAVFVVLGGLILPSFWEYAWIGIVMSLLFIFVIRPLAVFVSLAFFTGKDKSLQMRDLLFLDVVRETGVIPAVLLVSYATVLPDGEVAFSIGAWVILTSLIILPLLTSWWAKRIHAVS